MGEVKERVLIVDDDPDICLMLERALRSAFDVDSAENAADALAKMEANPASIVMSDQHMPETTGVELLGEIAKRWPRCARVLITASQRGEDLEEAVNVARVHRFCAKPLRIANLNTLLRGAIREVGLEWENRRLITELRTKNALLEKALHRVQDHERRLSVEVEARTLELRDAVAELEQLALRDGLTGLYNHRFFQETFEQELARARRYKLEVGLLFVDVDFFKRLNDTLGHPVGDAVLKQIAELLSVREERADTEFRGRVSDIVARYGGEEFVLVLPQTGRAGAAVKASRLRTLIEQFRFTSDDGVAVGKVTVSIGVAVYPEDGTTKQELVDRADAALYVAKDRGRNRIHLAGDMG